MVRSTDVLAMEIQGDSPGSGTGGAITKIAPSRRTPKGSTALRCLFHHTKTQKNKEKRPT